MDQFDTEHTLLRFNIRSIFTLTTVVAVCCFALVWISSDWPDDQRWKLLWICILLVSGLLLAVGLFVLLRYRVETKAGRRICNERPPEQRFLKFSLLAITCLVMFGFTPLPITILFDDYNSISLHIYIASILLLAGLFSGFLFLNFWWNGLFESIIICSNGIIVGQMIFHPWKNVGILDWNLESGALKIILLRRPFSIVVSKEMREDVDAVLAEHLQKKES